MGDIGGLAGADQVCQSLGAAIPGGGPWVAWLSDAANDARDRVALPAPALIGLALLLLAGGAYLYRRRSTLG